MRNLNSLLSAHPFNSITTYPLNMPYESTFSTRPITHLLFHLLIIPPALSPHRCLPRRVVVPATTTGVLPWLLPRGSHHRKVHPIHSTNVSSYLFDNLTDYPVYYQIVLFIQLTHSIYSTNSP